MDVIAYLKENYDYVELQNALRFNGVVDIYRKAKTGKISVFILPEKEWYYPENEEEFSDLVINNLEHYEQREPFKKCESGRMAYKEFKSQVRPSFKKSKRKKMKDTDVMPWGKYQGEKMANVPPDYLIWLFENNKCGGDVLQYIQSNESNLRKEIANNKKGIR